MRLSVVQMNPGADKAENIAQASRLIGEAVTADRPNIVSLPEVWDSLGGDRTVRNANAELLPAKGSNEPGGPAYEFLRDTARTHKVHVHGGSIIEKGQEKLFNTTVVFDPDGQEIARYRKMHLFDIVAPDGTGYRESNTYGAGDEVVTYEADGTKVGCAICYDLRFPDLFWKLREQGAEVIFLPSAFTLATGKDHWEVMIRSRAIETQCWFAAPATWGKHLEGKGEAALHLRPFHGRRSVGPRHGKGVGRCRLGHLADRPQGDRAGAPRHAGAGTPETRLIQVDPDRIAFLASATVLATEARERLVARYGDCAIEHAAVVVPLGGDGFMLETIHRVLPLQVPVYGMNCGSVGFLMNTFNEDDLPDRLVNAQEAVLYPLRMRTTCADGSQAAALAFNEVSLLRQLRQTSKIRVTVDGKVRLAELMCDGILISTPAGSTAYNLSAHGTIVPLSANLLPLTPISAFRPRRWRGALLPSTAEVMFDVLEADKRPTAAVADFTEVRDVVSVSVKRGSLGQHHRAVRSRPRAVRADHRRAVHRVASGAPVGPGSASPHTAKLERALWLHQQGRLAEAERIYREILQREPSNVPALHLFGVVAMQTGRPERAIKPIGKAIALHPDNAEAHNDLGLALEALGRSAEALAQYDRATALRTDFAEAHNNRGNALRALRRPAEALGGACASHRGAARPRGRALQQRQRAARPGASGRGAGQL